MKKFFTLLTLLLCAVTSTWAADIDISCSAYLSGTAGTPTVTDCTLTFYTNEGTAGTVPAGTLVGSTSYYQAKIDGDSKYYQVTLNKTVSATNYTKFKAGDIITVYLYTNDSNPGYQVGKTTKTVVSLSGQTTNTIITVPHTLTAPEIESDGTVRIYRNSSKTYFAGISVAGKRPARTPKWDWKNSSLSGVQGIDAAGTIDSDVSGISMNVLAAVPGTNIKLTDAGDYAQFNENTAMRIPVTTTKDKVIITAYPGQYNYTVGGTAASADITEHTATLKEVALGYVEIVATSTAYVYSVEVERYDEKEIAPQLLTFTAGGTTYYPEDLSWTEDPAGTFSTTIYVASLPAAAPTAVAYNGAVGTIIYSTGVATIPVTLSETTRNYVVTFSASATYTISYNGGSAAGVTGSRDDETKTEDVDFTLPSTPVFSRAGYIQSGWNTNADGISGAHYDLGGSYTANAAQTFYPEWTSLDYSFAPTLSSGTISSGSVVATSTGGKMVYTPASGGSPTLKYSTTSGSNCIEFGGASSCQVTITLDKLMKAGTVITLNYYVGTASLRGFKLANSGGTDKATFSQSAIGTYTESYTVVASDGLAGNNKFIIKRNNNAYLNSVTVAGCDDVAVITPSTDYSTLTSSLNLNFTGIEGLKAYIATEVSAGSVQMTQVNKVPAGTGLVLVKTSGSSFNVPLFDGTGADNVLGNKMAGSATATTAVAADAGYILKDGVFQPSSGGDLPAGKAYLNIAVSGARELTMSFEDETTGVNEVKIQKTDNQYFNLAGQRIAQPTKGLYIVNGKKVVIK